MVDVSEFIKENPYETDITLDDCYDDCDKDVDISIVDLFKDYPMTSTSSGDFKMECPDCGMQGGRTEGFMLFSNSNSAYCHSSGKWFRLLEAYALKKKIIKCLDGREKGSDPNDKILGGELFTMALEEFRNEFGTDMYDKLSDELHIKASIELPGNDHYTSTFADKLGEIYKSRNVLFYRGESKEVVEIGRYKRVSKDGEEYVETGFASIDGGRFVTLIEMFVKPWTTVFLKTGNKMQVNKSMTQSTGSIVLKSSNFQNRVPSINRIFAIPIPILYKKQLTFPKTGYDKRFGSWLPTNSPEIIKKDMTIEDAKELIETLFSEFCFASDKDKTHAIAGFITPFLHGLLPKFSTRTPVFIYMANRERAGKDYCAGVTGMLYEGAKIEQPAICNDEAGSNNEELRKKITAHMRQGKKRFHSANNKGLLNNSILEGVTTAEAWEDRMLGRNEVITFSNEMDYSLSGNLGIRLTPDMSNRARIVNLHLVDEDANAREFKNPDLHGWILKNREIILSALYTLIRNWVDKGTPSGTVPFTSFPEWSTVCGGIMEAANWDNPCKPDKTAIISLDSETEEMKLLFEAAYNQKGNQWLTKKDIQELVENENLMDHLDFNEKADKIKFGLKVDKFSRRMLSDVFMDVDSLEIRGSRRKYKFTKGSDQNILSTGNGGDGKNGGNKDILQHSKLKDVDLSAHDDKIKNLVKNGENGKEVGIDGIVGIDGLPCSDLLVSKYTTMGGSMPTMPTRPITQNTSNLQNSKKIQQIPQEIEGDKINPEIKDEVVKSSFDKFAKEQKIETDKKIKPEKEKTDRELQFFESPECESIKEQCTKDQVYKWIELNQNIGLQKMDEELGLGCLKHASNLIKENKVKRNEQGWEVIK